MIKSINYDDFSEDSYLQSLIENIQPNTQRMQKWFLKEDVSVEEIIKEAELILEKVDPMKAGGIVKSRLKIAEKAVKEYGIAPEKLKMAGKNAVKKFRGYYDKGLKPKEASKQITTEILKVAQNHIQKAISKSSIGKKAQDSEVKILIAIAAFIVILIMQGAITGLMALAGMPFGMGSVATVLLVIVIGPMIEEAVKTWFIEKNMPWTGTAVTFGIEAILYINSMMMMGASLPAALIARAVALLMHFATTAMQKVIIDKAPTSKPEERANYLFLGWCAGVLIHASWNALSLIYAKELNSLIR